MDDNSSPRFRALRFAAIALTLMLAAAACGDDGDASSQRPGDGTTSTSGQGSGGDGPSGSITYAVAVEIPTLDPVMDSKGLSITKSVFDWLVDIDAEGGVVPGLATKWEPNEDATSWVFTIRDDAVFHNGSPVTVDDVIFSYETVQNSEASTIRGNLSSLESMERVSDTEVRFNLKFPYALFPRFTSLIPIVPADAYDPAEFETAPIGSGPYEVVSFTPGQPAQLRAFADYWGDPPAFEEVTVVPSPQPDSRLTGIQSTSSGSFALAPVTVEHVPVIEGESDIDIISTPSNLVAYLSFNVTSGALGDENFRKAVTHAIDRETIVETILDGKGEPIGQMVAPVTFGYDDSIEPAEYDPELAKELLADSSYNGETIVFEYPTDGELPRSNDLAQAIQAYLGDVGINIELQGQTSAAFIPALQSKQLRHMFMFSWRPSTLDAGHIVNLSYNFDNWGYAQDAEIAELIPAQYAEPDEEARADLISQIWAIDQEKVYFAPLFNDQYHYAFRPDLVSYTPRADGLVFPEDLRHP